MEPVAERHNVVVLGAWNRRLFTPQWIAQEFASGGEVMLELAVNNPAIPVRLSYDGLRLQVASDRIIVSGGQSDDGTLGRVQEFAAGILDRLSHTPVSAAGINFEWRDSDPGESIVNLFDLPDGLRLADAGVGVKTTTINRVTDWEDRTLNIELNLGTDGAFQIGLNFHQSVQSASDARAYICQGMVELRERAEQLLSSTYGFQF